MKIYILKDNAAYDSYGDTEEIIFTNDEKAFQYFYKELNLDKYVLQVYEYNLDKEQFVYVESIEMEQK